jgi:GntR family transcriptional regulator
MSSASRPVYLKLRDQIAAAIIDGTYGEGELLPSVRNLAAEQGANPLTVAKAYQQFQIDGLVEVQRGVGMLVVSGAARKLRESEKQRFLLEEWPGIADKICLLGISTDELLHEVGLAVQ